MGKSRFGRASIQFKLTNARTGLKQFFFMLLFIKSPVEILCTLFCMLMKLFSYFKKENELFVQELM